MFISQFPVRNDCKDLGRTLQIANIFRWLPSKYLQRVLTKTKFYEDHSVSCHCSVYYKVKCILRTTYCTKSEAFHSRFFLVNMSKFNRNFQPFFPFSSKILLQKYLFSMKMWILWSSSRWNNLKTRYDWTMRYRAYSTWQSR